MTDTVFLVFWLILGLWLVGWAFAVFSTLALVVFFMLSGWWSRADYSFQGRRNVGDRQRVAGFEELFETASEALLVLDSSLSLSRVNPAAKTLFRSDLEEMTLSDFQKLVEEWAGTRVDWPDLRGMGRNREGFSMELAVDHSDGEVFAVEGLPVSDGGWMIRFSRKAIQVDQGMDFRQNQKLASVGRLAMEVTHDFNNLLTAINGNLAILEMELESRRIRIPERENLKFAIRAGNRSAELVKQLLKFSRNDNREISSFDVGGLVKEVVGILESSIDPSIALETEVSSGLWSGRGDSNMTSQVLVNLITNARDAIDGTGRIRVIADNASSRKGDSGRRGDYVRLVVEDDGCGMTEEVKSRIFHPFFTTKGVGKGTGLGLSTSLKIVEQMGGWIEVASESGQGSRIEVYLPRGKDRRAGNGGVDRGNSGVPEKSSTGETVLIVEDMEEVQMVARCLLKRIGYQVLVASDGEEALEVYRDREDEIDLVMLDLRMPKLGGRETYSRLREEFGHVPVLICSGNAVELSSFEPSGSIPEGFIQKPYQLDVVTRSVRNALDKDSLVA